MEAEIEWTRPGVGATVVPRMELLHFCSVPRVKITKSVISTEAGL